MQKSKGKIALKVLGIILAIIVAIAAVLSIVVGALWGDVMTTVMSFEQLQERNDSRDEGSVYYMKVAGGFYLDKYVEQGGASSDKELIKFITDNLTKGLVDVSIGESDVNCSAFMAKTPSEDILFGRNYDFDKTNVCITICGNPGKDRYKSFSTVDLNYVGMDTETDVEGLMNKITCFAAAYAPLDGMNEKGLSCGIFMSYQGNDLEKNDSGTVATDQKDATKKNFTSTTMQRMILDYCATVDEAVDMISKYNLHDSAKSSFHYMIADATGKSAILEWLPDNGTDATDNDGSARKLVVTYNDDPMYDALRASGDFKYQWITNFIVHNAEKYYEGYDERDIGGLDRYRHIYNRLNAAHGVLENEEAAMTLLSEVGRRTWNGGVTVHSVVYNLTDKTVRWIANENYNDLSKTYLYSFETGKLTTAA